MKIEKTKYAIASKIFPLAFDDGDGYQTDDIDNAYFYDSYEDAEIIKRFDEPENFQILTVKVTYEF